MRGRRRALTAGGQLAGGRVWVHARSLRRIWAIWSGWSRAAKWPVWPRVMWCARGRRALFGRGGALGDVDAAVVDSALGYFAPSVVAKHWDSGRAIVSPRT